MRLLLSLLVALVALLAPCAAQSPAACRPLMVDCLQSCAAECAASDADCKLGCKRVCANEHECALTRDHWPVAKTAWCCACRGVRC